MHSGILEKLREITEEERAALNGTGLKRELYTESAEFVVDSHKLLQAGRLIELRPHTRFVHFPRHTHNYVEMIYMCAGTTTHLIEGEEVRLNQGELLLLSQNACQEILPAGEGDLAVNFIILPEFFDYIVGMMGEEKSILRDFLIACLKKDNRFSDYFHFKVAQVLPVQNLMENMLWSLTREEAPRRRVLQTTMGLLFLHLLSLTEAVGSSGSEEGYEKELLLQCLRYVEEKYREGSLAELAEQTNQSVYSVTRLIKRHTGRTYKELVQGKRLNQAAYLLGNTGFSVSEIISRVGYDNTSYFYRIFRAHYGMSPREYRLSGGTLELGDAARKDVKL